MTDLEVPTAPAVQAATNGFSLDDLPELTLSPVSAAGAPKRTRREALRLGLGVAAAAAAATTFNVLRSPSPASASGPGLSKYPYHNPYGSGVGSACWSDQGCATLDGSDTIDNWYCSTCAEYQSNHSNYIGFMFTGGRNGTMILDDNPNNTCMTTAYDYWVHDGQPCGYCPYQIQYRCHDGIKYTGGGGSTFVVCHSVLRCNNVQQGVSC